MMSKVMSIDEKALWKKFEKRRKKAEYWFVSSAIPCGISLIMGFFAKRFPILEWPIICIGVFAFIMLFIGIGKGIAVEGEMFKRGWIKYDGMYL